jgi:hypothetical protein
MTGDWQENEKYGVQFVMNSTPVEETPADEESMLRYFAGGRGLHSFTLELNLSHSRTPS